MSAKAQNSTKAVKKKPRGRPFPKGVSGNPGGRPCMPEELRKMAQAKAPDALKIALELMDSADSDTVRLAAAREVMDRGYGKPTQPTELTGTLDVTAMTAEQRQARLDELMRKALDS